MKTITIVGTGNVGTHLFKAFSTVTGLTVDLVNSRQPDISRLQSDFIIIAVSDKAIATVAKAIANKTPGYDGIVAHTSGSVGMEILRPIFKHYGVFYPLQTFSKDIDIQDYRSIPVFVEGESEKMLGSLKELAGLFSGTVYPLTSDLRRQLHLASVFACNFVNAMYAISEDILKAEGIPFDVVRPLIEQTARKVTDHSPAECQTGPARRGDMEVIHSHEAMLGENEKLEKIYRTITDYIIEKYVVAGK